MKKALINGILAGITGAFVVSLAETFFGNGAPFVASFAVCMGLVTLTGVFIGILTVAVRALLAENNRPKNWFKTLFSTNNPTASASIVSIGILSLFFLPVLYRIIYFFLTNFHHHGLAAISLAFVLAIFAVISILLTRKLSILLGTFFTKFSNRFLFLKKPIVCLIPVILLWTIALAPPLHKGSDATGIFGFMGFLMKDGLGAGPLLALLLMTSTTFGVLWILFSKKLTSVFFKKNRLVLLVASGCLIAALSSPFVAAIIIKNVPQTLDRLDSADGLSTVLGKIARKIGDRDKDGHSRWMGGRDCDDNNNKIYPGAREIPDNQIDEDCSGKDLKLDELRLAVSDKKNTNDEQIKKLVKPNFPKDVSVFLITVDTLRWNEPGFMGYERPVTPNLDKLVQNGTIYNRAYALGSYTGQSIPPFLTGKYASELMRNDRHETRISGKEKFAAEYFCNEKVKCNAILSHFLFEKHFGWNQGFDEWKVVGSSPSGSGHVDSKYNSHAVANRAIRWLKKPENTEGQFFLWTHFMDPHKEYLDHKGFKRFGDDRRSRYDHEVLFTDYHIGRMIDYFKTLPAFEKTIFIVTADHGEAFNEHGRWCHGKELWEEIIRVPLAIVGPQIAKKRIKRQTSHIDMFATFLDIFNVEIPKGIHGQSLLYDWVDGQLLTEKPIISDQPQNPYYETRRIFIKDGWKLHDLPDAGTHRLYKITNDYERGESLVESEPEAFKKIKAAYDLFMATEFKPLPPVKYGGSDVNKMPSPPGATL